MALIYQSRFRALDDDGAPMPFALLYTRDNSAHSTPKATYTTPALSVPNSNPLVADDAGWFGQMHAEEGEEFYLILVAAGGDPNAPYKTYTDMTALGGAGTGQLVRTFAESRYQVASGDTGAGNLGTIVSYGSASPVDTGGFVLEEGWDGTQGTKKVVNFAEVEFKGDLVIDGEFTFAGDTSGVVTAAGSVNIALPAGFTAWRLELSRIQPSTGQTIEAYFAFDSVPTFKTGVDDYGWGILGLGPTNALGGGAGTDNSDSRIALFNTGTPTAGSAAHATLTIFSEAGLETGLDGEIAIHEDGSYGFYLSRFAGQTRAKNYGKATYVQLKASTGTFSLRWKLSGISDL